MNAFFKKMFFLLTINSLEEMPVKVLRTNVQGQGTASMEVRYLWSRKPFFVTPWSIESCSFWMLRPKAALSLLCVLGLSFACTAFFAPVEGLEISLFYAEMVFATIFLGFLILCVVVFWIWFFVENIRSGKSGPGEEFVMVFFVLCVMFVVVLIDGIKFLRGLLHIL